MKKLLALFFLFALALAVLAFIAPKKKDRVLVFSMTRGFRHKSIADGIAAIQQLGKLHGFDVEATEDSTAFNRYKDLKPYKAVIFLSPTGNGLFNTDQQQAFMQYMHHGGGFVGIHAATDCLYDWPWYGRMVGGYFVKHPPVQLATLQVVDSLHPATKGLPALWKHRDEWYNFKQFNTDVRVLIKLDESSIQGGDMHGNHPISWYHAFEGGRVFYTGLGHTPEAYSDSLFLQHLLGGILYAMNK